MLKNSEVSCDTRWGTIGLSVSNKLLELMTTKIFTGALLSAFAFPKEQGSISECLRDCVLVFRIEVLSVIRSVLQVYRSYLVYTKR